MNINVTERLYTRAHAAGARVRRFPSLAACVTAVLCAAFLLSASAGIARADSVPVGAIVAYAGSATPAGWVPADGAALSRSSFAELYDAVGTTFGAGDGSSTFNVPDMRGRIPLGVATAGTGSTLAAAGGSLDHTHTLNAAHTHGFVGNSHSHSVTFPNHGNSFSFSAGIAPNGNGAQVSVLQQGLHWLQSFLSGPTVASGAGAAPAFNSASASQSATSTAGNPPYLTVNYLVKGTVGASLPAGAVVGSGRSTLGASSPAADGAFVSKATYPALFAAIGHTYNNGVDPGDGTFRLPSLRQRFPLGRTSFGTASQLGETGGAISHTHSGAVAATTHSVNVPGHTHSASRPAHQHGLPGGIGTVNTMNSAPDYNYYSVASLSGSVTSTGGSEWSTSASAGSGTVTSSSDGAGTATAAGATPRYRTIEYGVATATISPEIGTIVAWGASAPPPGWVVADGSALSRTEYTRLFSAIGTSFGIGDGSTTFNVPDLSGRFPLGKAASGIGANLNDAGGALDHTHAVTGPAHTHTAAVPNHAHSFPFSGHQHNIPVNKASVYYAAGWPAGAANYNPGTLTSAVGGATTITSSSAGAATLTSASASGAGTSSAANPAYLALRLIIRAGDPPAATPVSPAAGAWVTTTSPVLTARFDDPDTGRAGQLDFELCSTNASEPWSASCGASFSSGSASNVANGGTGSWTASGLTNGATYYWRVRATRDTGLAGPWSTPQSLRVDASPPPAVTNLSAPSPTRLAPALTWTPALDSISGTAYYRVYRSTSSGTLGVQVNSDAATTSGSYTDTATLTDGDYWYTVRPVDAAGNEQTIGNPQVQVRYDTTPPPAVTDTATTSSSTPTATTLTWSTVTDTGSGTAYYRVYRSTTSGTLGTQVNSDASTTGGSFAAGTLSADTSYYFTVRAVDAAGNEQNTGNNQVHARYDTPAAPTLVSPGGDGAPSMEIRLDGMLVGTVLVPDTGWANYTISTPVTAGSRTVSVTYSNDTAWGAYDRNLHLDSVTFPGGGERVEAEAMTGSGGGGVVTSDATASGGQYVSMVGGGGERSHTMTLASGSSIVVRARGTHMHPNGILSTVTPTLTARFDDANGGDSGTVDFQVCSNWDCSTVVASGSGAAAAAATNATWTPASALPEGTRLYWRARSTDSAGLTGSWSSTWSIFVQRAPDAPTLVRPLNASSTADATPLLTATFTDPETWDTGTVSYQVCGNATCTAVGDPVASGDSVSGIASGSQATWSPASGLAAGTYHWRARATDSRGRTGAWSSSWQLRIGVPSITVSVNAASVALSPAMLFPGDNATATSTVTATSDNHSGYVLSATDESNTAGMRHTSTANTIADWTGNGTPTLWGSAVSGYFGMGVLSVTGGKDTNRWGTGTTTTDYANLLYVGLRNGTSTQLFQTNTYSGASEQVVVAWRANVGNTQAAGNYTTTVTFTATANI